MNDKNRKIILCVALAMNCGCAGARNQLVSAHPMGADVTPGKSLADTPSSRSRGARKFVAWPPEKATNEISKLQVEIGLLQDDIKEIKEQIKSQNRK